MSSALPACCLEAAGGGPCIPLASRILKDRSKPWQGTARANSYVFHGGKYRNWDEVSTANSVEAVRRGESVCRAAELHSVPRSTLSDILHGEQAYKYFFLHPEVMNISLVRDHCTKCSIC